MTWRAACGPQALSLTCVINVPTNLSACVWAITNLTNMQNASLLQNRFARKVIGAVILVSNLRWAVKSDWTWDFTAILVLRKCLNALNMFEFNVFFSLPVQLISLLRIYLQIHLSRLSPHCLGWLFAVFHAVLLPLMPQLSQSLCTAAVSSPVVESNLLHIPGNSVGPIFGDALDSSP